MYRSEIEGKYPYGRKDVFMGFHCGNGPICKMANYELTNHVVRMRGPELEKMLKISGGAVNGNYQAGDVTVFRLQSTADGALRSYVAEGEILPVDCKSYGSIGLFAIEEMQRFFQYVLIERNYPHHAAVAFGHYGKEISDIFRYFGVEEVMVNLPKSLPYPTENMFLFKKRK